MVAILTITHFTDQTLTIDFGSGSFKFRISALLKIVFHPSGQLKLILVKYVPNIMRPVKRR